MMTPFIARCQRADKFQEGKNDDKPVKEYPALLFNSKLAFSANSGKWFIVFACENGFVDSEPDVELDGEMVHVVLATGGGAVGGAGGIEIGSGLGAELLTAKKPSVFRTCAPNFDA